MRAQLAHWRARLDAGEKRLGWKIAFNAPAVQKQLGLDASAIGFMTSATRIDQAEKHSLAGGTNVFVEPEVAVVLAGDVAAGAAGAEAWEAVASIAPALEVVDIDRPFEDLALVLERNAFHRAVAVGQGQPAEDRLLEALAVRIERNGRVEREAEVGRYADEVVASVCRVAALLGRFDQQLSAGDVVIAGSLTEPLPVHAGDRIVARVDPLGELAIGFGE